MTPELKAKWITALRSGEYTQGVGALRADIPEGCAYCCLGVLAEQANGAAAWDRRNPHRDDYIMKGIDSDGSGLRLPLGVREYLVKMNDSERWSFPKIADWIEANV